MAKSTKADHSPAAGIHENSIQLTLGDDPRVDSRIVAARLAIEHESVVRTLDRYPEDFHVLGKLRFEIGPSPESKTGQKVRYALLSEDQAYLLLTYSRNTKRVRETKIALVKAFKRARLAADITQAEYLPTYRDLHDLVGLLASGSSNARFVHMNVNRAINQAIGIGAGQRTQLDLPRRSLLVVAQTVACMAMAGADNHRDGYQKAKSALQSVQALRLA